tara:strand:+ start:318 stop:446 length:129 start_codon:yes stop_codon:yes gene_type:complete
MGGCSLNLAHLQLVSILGDGADNGMVGGDKHETTRVDLMDAL